MVIRDANGQETIVGAAYLVADAAPAGACRLLASRRAFRGLHSDWSPSLRSEFHGGFRILAVGHQQWADRSRLTRRRSRPSRSAALGVVAGVGRFGVVSVAASGSRTQAGIGFQLTGTAEFSLGQSGSMHPRSARSAPIRTSHPSWPVMPQSGGVCDRARHRPGSALRISLPLFSDRASLGLSFTNLVLPEGEPTRLLGLNFSTSVGRNATFYASAYRRHEGLGSVRHLCRLLAASSASGRGRPWEPSTPPTASTSRPRSPTTELATTPSVGPSAMLRARIPAGPPT